MKALKDIHHPREAVSWTSTRLLLPDAGALCTSLNLLFQASV